MRTGMTCHHSVPLNVRQPHAPSPALLPTHHHCSQPEGRNYLSKPAGAASLSSDVWNLHLGGSRTSGARSRCWAEVTGDVASSPPQRSLPQSKERERNSSLCRSLEKLTPSCPHNPLRKAEEWHKPAGERPQTPLSCQLK